MWRMAIGACALVGLGCAGSSQPQEGLPGENCFGGAVLVNPVVSEIAVGDSALLTAKRLSFILSCFPGAGTSFVWSSQRPDLVSITRVNDSTAFVRALGVGTFLVWATIEGREVAGPLSRAVEMRIR